MNLNTDCSLLDDIDDKNDDKELPKLPGSEKKKDAHYNSEVTERDLVKGKNIFFTEKHD